MKKIMILDANSLFNRAFYGIRPLSTKQGLPTNAVFGYINMVKKHLDAIRPDFAVAAFDVHAPTFRHKADPEYKAGRRPMPDDLRAQLPYLKEATRALGLAICEKEGWEADDILGTLSRLAEEGGNEAYLVTGDRDSYQLVSQNCHLILAGTHKDENVTPAWINEKFGLAPRQMIDVKALAGDSSDNIPGVRGIGEKTAVKLIAERGDLDGVYRDVAALPVGPSAKEKLAAGKDDAYRSRFLAEICRTVPGLERIEDFPYTGPVAELLKPLLVTLEFSKMLHTFGLDTDPVEEPALPAADPMQGSMFDLCEKETPIQEMDAETVSADPLFLTWDETDFYALVEDRAFRLTGNVRALLEKVPPVVCDGKEFLHLCHTRFGTFDRIRARFDLFLAAYVVNSQDSSTTLSRLSLGYLKEAAPPSLSSDPERQLRLMARLYPILDQALTDGGARELYDEIELPLTPVLCQMEIVGFQVSREGIEEYGRALERMKGDLEREIFSMAGEEFLISSPKQLGKILFEKLALPAGKKTKTGYATDAETLQKLRHLSPIIDMVLNWRAVAKLHSTYVLGLLEQIRPDGRIHTVFHQRLTATGRLSSAEPNLQNIPVKTDLGREMRKFFTAKDENYVLVDADYSQIELRLLAHMSGDETLIRYFLEGRDIHTKTASEIFHVPPEEVTSQMRKSAKAVNFGIVYGIGEYSLSQDIGVPMRVAKDYINAYFALFPGVKRYLDGIKERAAEQGYVTTLFGRKRVIPEITSQKKNLVAFGQRVAMNTPIQGTAADIIKLAMVRVDRRLAEEKMASRLILQVHDELILECPKEEAEKAAAILKEEMEGVVNWSVPLVVEEACGSSWFDAK